MWLKVRNSMPWGSKAPSSARGAWMLVCIWEIQSKRISRNLQWYAGSTRPGRGCNKRPGSKNTSHLAVSRMARLPSSVRALPHKSSSSRTTLEARASAKHRAPASVRRLSRSDRRRRPKVGEAKTTARARTPTSVMPFAPRQSSPRAVLCGDSEARATARTPMSPRRRQLSSSSSLRGGARRHSRARVCMQAAQNVARPPKVGTKSMMRCRSSGSRSLKLSLGATKIGRGGAWAPPTAAPSEDIGTRHRPPAPGVCGWKALTALGIGRSSGMS
mmetsp:Transcript_15215/g.53433  ORF Transcript_15215/g.53433 Transcript_15215/m.53433 type:complete len:273 (+) Transcript_15215:793-1611(+)